MTGPAPDDQSPPFDDTVLAALRPVFEAASPVIVELRLGHGEQLPERQIFHRYEMLVAYLRMVARPGDTIAAWRFDEVCRETNALVPHVRLRPTTK